MSWLSWPRRNPQRQRLKLAGVTDKIEESALYDSQGNGLAAAMVTRRRRGPDGKTACDLRKARKFARALPHFAERILFMIPGGHEECGKS